MGIPLVFLALMHNCAIIAALPSGVISLISATDSNLIARHCNYELFACNGHSGPDDDYNFRAIPALNRAPGALSFQSINFPDRYISISKDGGVESGRLGIDSPVDNNDASFAVVSGLSDHSLVSLRSLSTGQFQNAYMAINNKLEGACSSSYSLPSSDIILSLSPLSSAAATWNISAPPPPKPQNHTLTIHADQILHRIDPMYMGCHSDSGYTHQPRGLYSQMIFGEVFEFGLWPNKVMSASLSSATIELDHTRPFNTFPSLHVAFKGQGYAGVANRGLGNEGLVFQDGQVYEGYLFAMANEPVTIIVRLDDYTTGKVRQEELKCEK